jgi:hypothetical protein
MVHVGQILLVPRKLGRTCYDRTDRHRAAFGHFSRQIPALASAYISGISSACSSGRWKSGRTPCAAISISSKYLIRVDGRHIWNPSNLGIVAMLVLAADTVASLSVQWGNTLLPMVTVWLFGAVIITLGRLHVTLTYVASFLASPPSTW